VADGEKFDAGTNLARVTGRARSVLLAERVALNLAAHESAIATKTAEFVALAEGTKARITDTRKTTPGLRILERFAVRCGGGANHRYSLSDAVLAKDNHLAVMTGGDPARLTALLAAPRPSWDTPPTSRWRWTAPTRSSPCWRPAWTPSCWTTSPWRS
jgi:nicotinate-nucleotide pyrophosphorylase (carboxylating)